MEQHINEQEYKSINQQLAKNSDVYKMLGLNQLKGVKGLSTVDEANRLREDAKKSKGTTCNCCGQKVKLYKRVMTPNMALALIVMHDYIVAKSQGKEHDKLDYFCLDEIFGNVEGIDKKKLLQGFTMLKFWDCIAPMPTRKDRIVYRRNWFTITDIGIRFVLREIGLPMDAFVYNNTVDSFSNRYMTIDQVLEQAGINYNEIYK